MQLDKDGYVHLPVMACPYCGKLIDCTTSVDGRPLIPQDADISLCFGCAQPCIFVVNDLGVSVRKPTPQEMVEILAEHEDFINRLIQFNARKS